MNKQKGLAPILIVLLIAGVIGGIFLYQKQFKTISVSRPSPTASNSEDATNWNVYTNNIFKYQVSYPDDWSIEELPVKYLTSQTNVKIPVATTTLKDNKSSLYISIMGNFQGGFCEGGGCQEVNFQTASGLIGKQYTSKTSIYYTFSLGKNNIFISTVSDKKELTNQILSTFKFLDQNQVNKISPNNSYSITEQTIGDRQIISIKDRQGNVVVDDLVSKNSKEIGYNVKFKCQCGTLFKEWVNDTAFSIKIVNGGGEEYEYLVNAKTGKVDESSFKKIK